MIDPSAPRDPFRSHTMMAWDLQEYVGCEVSEEEGGTKGNDAPGLEGPCHPWLLGVFR